MNNETHKQIRLFEKLWLFSLFLGIIQSALFLNAAGMSGGPALMTVVFQLLILVAALSLVLMVIRKRSNVAKWILVLMILFGLIAYIPNLAVFFEQGIMGFVSAAQLGLQFLGIYYLFEADSRDWFSKS